MSPYPLVSHPLLPNFSQISETSPSCELMRWSGAVGRDPKPLIHHLNPPSPRYNLPPCALMVHLNPEAAAYKDWKERRGQRPCLSWVIYLFMEAPKSHFRTAGIVVKAQRLNPHSLQGEDFSCSGGTET